MTEHDMVSRQDVINVIEHYCDNGCEIAEDNWCPDCQRSNFVKMIKKLPPSPNAPKTLDSNSQHAQGVESVEKTQLSGEDATFDCISRQAACDAVCKAGCDSGFCGVECPEVMALRNLQPVQPEVLACGEGELIAQSELLQDGTLMIDVTDLDTVKRVIVSSGKMCKVFYLDDSERRTDDKSSM